MQENKQIILALDSSSAPLLLTLSAGGKTYSAKHSGIKQEEYLFTMVNKLYGKAGLKFKDTTHFFFIKGPGRFTGIRIGITLASMLQSFVGAHITSADLFEVLHAQAAASKEYKKWAEGNPNGKIAIVLHAFREEYFTCVYDGDKYTPVWTSLEGVREILNKESAPLFIAGWGKERENLSLILPAKFTYAEQKTNAVQPKTMLALALGAPKQDVLEPLYLKPARFELEQKK